MKLNNLHFFTILDNNAMHFDIAQISTYKQIILFTSQMCKESFIFEIFVQSHMYILIVMRADPIVLFSTSSTFLDKNVFVYLGVFQSSCCLSV